MTRAHLQEDTDCKAGKQPLGTRNGRIWERRERLGCEVHIEDGNINDTVELNRILLFLVWISREKLSATNQDREFRMGEGLSRG